MSAGRAAAAAPLMYRPSSSSTVGCSRRSGSRVWGRRRCEGRALAMGVSVFAVLATALGGGRRKWRGRRRRRGRRKGTRARLEGGACRPSAAGGRASLSPAEAASPRRRGGVARSDRARGAFKRAPHAARVMSTAFAQSPPSQTRGRQEKLINKVRLREATNSLSITRLDSSLQPAVSTVTLCHAALISDGERL